MTMFARCEANLIRVTRFTAYVSPRNCESFMGGGVNSTQGPSYPSPRIDCLIGQASEHSIPASLKFEYGNDFGQSAKIDVDRKHQ